MQHTPSKNRCQTRLFLATALIALTNACVAATYYVDFEAGSDGNNGASPTAAFKHCPGDPEAKSGGPASVKLQAGDMVIFKGGVAYRGMVNVNASGSKEKPIIFDGNTDGKFGTGKAIIDGADPITGWKKCASANDAKGNPKFAEIFYLDVPRPKAWNSLNLCDAENALPIAQTPNPRDPFFQEYPEDFYLVPEPLNIVGMPKITPGEGMRVNKERPLLLMVVNQKSSSTIIEPVPGADFTVELDKPTAISAVGIAPQPSYPALKEVAFLGDGKELLKTTLQKNQKEIQKFNLPSPVTISKLTVKFLSIMEGEKGNYGAVRQVAAFGPDGKDVLQSDPYLTLTDPKNLTGKDPNFYDGVIFAFHGGHNVVDYLPITGYDPAAHRIKMPIYLSAIYKETRYSLFNSVRFIDQPGEYSVEALPDAKMSRVFLLPPKVKENQPADIGAAARPAAFALDKISNVTVQGFVLRRQNGPAFDAKPSCSNLALKDSEVTLVRAGAAVNGSGVDGVLIERCYVHHNPGHTRGICLNTCSNPIVQNCKIEKNSATGLDYYHCSDGKMIGNTVLDNHGMHANGLTLYVGNKNMLVERNYVAGGYCAITFQEIENIIIRNNIFDGNKCAPAVGIWPTQPLKNIQFLNNLMINADTAHEWAAGLFSNGSKIEGLVVKNNIIDGLSSDHKVFKGADFSNNIYTRIGPDQKEGLLGKNEVVETDLHKIFVDPDKGDFHLKPGSPAIGKGVDVGLEEDMSGAKILKGKAPDIGPYQFQGK